jgi:hypothetical protein
VKLVEIEWLDSSGVTDGGDTWQDKDEVIAAAGRANSLSCWAAGYIVCEDERQVTITPGHNGEHGMVLAPTVIPRIAVVSIRDLGSNSPDKQEAE